jgi:hypothetical protein
MEPTVAGLTDRLTGAIDFWRHRTIGIDPESGERTFDNRAIDQIGLQLELLSRLSIRLAPERAQQLHHLALGAIRDPDLRNLRLLKPLDHLLKRTAEAMPSKMRGELALSAIEFPLQSEIDFVGPVPGWPTPVTHIADCLLRDPANATRWSMRVQQLIEATRSGEVPTRADAALRLYYLDEANLLSPAEREEFGAALWAQQDPQNRLPTGTHLLPHVFLDLPAPDSNAATRYFTEILFKTPASKVLNPTDLMVINGAATPTKRRVDAVRPVRQDALLIFDAILTLKPLEAARPYMIGAEMLQRRASARQVGPVLTKAIMPVLVHSDYTDERIVELFRLIDEGLAPSAIEALPLVVSICPKYEERAIRSIRRAIVGRSRDEIGGAIMAIENWLSLPQGTNCPLPGSISEQVVAAIANRRETSLYNLIWCASRLLSADALTVEQRLSLVEALRDLFDEMKYDRLDLTGHPELSLVRAECVKLAKQLSDVGVTDTAISDWIEVGQTDELPEVRWALTDDEIAS